MFWLFTVEPSELGPSRTAIEQPPWQPFGVPVDIPPANPEFGPIGHCALDWRDYLGDASLADRSEKRM